MPSVGTADPVKVADDPLRDVYFIVRKRDVWFLCVFFSTLGIGTVSLAYTAAKAAINDGAAKVATDRTLEFEAAAKQSSDAANRELEQIRRVREGAERTASNMVPEFKRLEDKHDVLAKMHAELAQAFSKLGTSPLGLGGGWKCDGKDCSILELGDRLYLVNEHGNAAIAEYDPSTRTGTIRSGQWQIGYRFTVSEDGTTLKGTMNGAEWHRPKR